MIASIETLIHQKPNLRTTMLVCLTITKKKQSVRGVLVRKQAKLYWMCFKHVI